METHIVAQKSPKTYFNWTKVVTKKMNPTGSCFAEISFQGFPGS